MAEKPFNIKLIPEFTDDKTMVEWIEDAELVCVLCEIRKIKQILPLHSKGGTLAVYRQLNKEQKSDIEQIKRALLIAFGTNLFMVYDQFQTQHLRPSKRVDVFLVELKKLAVPNMPLPEHWMTCAFASGLPSHVKQILQASSRMEDLTLNQLLTRALSIMINEKEAEEPVAI